LGGEINGFELARIVVEQNPNAKIIIPTADDGISKQALEAGFSLIVKPFKMHDLLESISA